MLESLKIILARIATGELLPPTYFVALDCDAALNTRDNDEAFEAEWARLSGDVNGRWATSNIPHEARSLVEDIRRESFLAASRATQQHEIASYVSDDFDLVVRGRLVASTDPFLAQLWGAYERGAFPAPPL